MRFLKTLPPLFERLDSDGIDFALIGGIAVSLAGVDRTTEDVDFLTLLSDSEKIDGIMKDLGYEVLKRSEDISNYWREGPDGGRVDFMFAHRPYAQAMLKRALSTQFMGQAIKTLRPEDLIGLKIQAISNNPARERKDRYDIEDLMMRHAKTLDWSLVREYFDVFGRITEYNDLRRKYQ